MTLQIETYIMQNKKVNNMLILQTNVPTQPEEEVLVFFKPDGAPKFKSTQNYATSNFDVFESRFG